ncbi:MAG: T9SS type A sorting domain-containing protein [Bacteroidales bacterium]|nr:T9SS type A sorting domain-containing protein [Bacteroidales bacterium]
MQRKLLVALLCCIGSATSIAAEDGTPCLIFSGAAGKEYALDLTRYNRITFGENSMTVSNSKDPSDNVELLYSAYHHLEVGLAQASGLDDVAATDLSLVYEAETSTLKVESTDENTYAVGVFNINGVLVCHTQLRGGEGVSLATLAPGVYVAVATGETGTQKIKFVK